MKKKIFATLLAAVLTIASTMTAFADENPKVELVIGSQVATVELTGDGQYTLEYSGDAVTTGQWGCMYVKSTNNSTLIKDASMKIVSIELNGTSYTVPTNAAADNESAANDDFTEEIFDIAFYNRWAGAGASIGDGTGDDLNDYGVTSAKVVISVSGMTQPETTTTAPDNSGNNDGATTSANINTNDTGDATNYSVAIAMIALAVAGVVFFNKKIVTEK